MRTFQLVVTSSVALVFGFAAGCGGKVVVDTGAGGSFSGSSHTGMGGSAVTHVTSALISVGTSGPCDTQSCMFGSDGSCGCQVSCNGQTFRTRCIAQEPSGAFCECSVDGTLIATCDQDAGTCEFVFTGCCGQFFNAGG